MRLDSPLYGAALMLAGLVFGLDAAQWYASNGSSAHASRAAWSAAIFLVGLPLFLLVLRSRRHFK